MTKLDDACVDPRRSPLRSVSTPSVAGLLADLGISILVSTYQAGYLVLLRADGDRLNTHFRRFARPMGLAYDDGRLALGTAREIIQFRNMRAATQALPATASHDACYLPRHVHITGDIDVHELQWGQEEELWLVNTRLSCLCTLNQQHSFVPRWRPPFISGLAIEDRCHLNGLSMIDGQPRYVTALSTTDSPEGWRPVKNDSGAVIDVASNQTIMTGLCMPHSPRWYNGRLWLLESGQGLLGIVDLVAGQFDSVAQLPGFPRGLDFIGPYALVGVSHVRQSSTFDGLPISHRVERPMCGVSIINLTSGQEVGFVRFEEAVRETFDVRFLPHRFPEILEPGDPLLDFTFAIPDDALADVVSPRQPNDGQHE